MGSRYIDVVQSLIDSPGERRPAEYKAALQHLSKEIKSRLTAGSPNSKDFICAGVRALARIKSSTHLELRMSCFSDASYFLFANGFDAEALETSRHLDALAKQAQDLQWTRKSETISGIVHSHSGNIAESLIRFSRALTLARELHETRGEITVLVNLGTALNYAGLYREAIPSLLRAAALAEGDLTTSAYLPQALCNLAQSHFHLGEYAQGFDAISESLRKSLEPSDALGALSRTAREFTMVHLSLEVGDVRLANSHANLCRSYAAMARSRRADFMATVASGLCEIHLGNVSRGLTTLENCLINSGSDGTPERMEALVALAKAYDDSGRPERGLKCVQELMRGIAATRQASISALLSVNLPRITTSPLATEGNDLAALREREAHLRLRIAEKEAAASQLEMLSRLAVAADLREEPSGEHGYRVGKLAALFALDIGWSAEDAETLELASRLHDIGKLAVPDRILLNSEELKKTERQFVSCHSAIGAELLGGSANPLVRLAESIARFHHEWWDGNGYPQKRRERNIPVEARIVALADVFDALTHGRPFAAPWLPEQAIAYIKEMKGNQFDPNLTDRFVLLIERLIREPVNLDRFLGQASKDSPFLQARNRIRALVAEEREKEKIRR